MAIQYTNWEFAWHFDRTATGSIKSHGNFAIGFEVNRHPRFREYIFNFWWFSIGVTWHREAVIEKRPSRMQKIGTAFNDSAPIGDGTHLVTVQQNSLET